MIIVSNIVGILAVGLTILAYYQVDRLSFLKINVFAVSFFGLSLMINNGMSGGFIAFVNVLVYIVAIFTRQSVRKKLSFFVPPAAFAIAFYWYGVESIDDKSIPAVIRQNLPFIPAIATFFVSLSALQQRIGINKIILFIGVCIWGFYSYLMHAWYALAADCVGLIVILISLYKLSKLGQIEDHTKL